MTNAPGRLTVRAHDILLRGLIVIGLGAGATALAAPMVDPGGLRLARAEVADAAHSHPHAEPARLERLVWEGADVDGDGQADFANPTGKGERGSDAYGEGRFGASRDGGARRHEGADFVADAGQQVVAPISGYVTKIGFAYPGDQTLRFVEIANPALHYAVRVFYVDPSVAEGASVAIGRPIGRTHTLQQKYPDGMTDHVHLEVINTAGRRVDPARMLTARWENRADRRG